MPVLLLYFIDGEGNSGLPNATEIQNLQADQEILLIDILNHFQSSELLRTNVGINFNYYAEINNELFPLESPSSLVPVNRDTSIIRLRLVPSTSPPLVPYGQSFNFYDSSRRTFYSPSAYNATRMNSQTAFQHQAVYAEGQRINRPQSEVTTKSQSQVHNNDTFDPFSQKKTDISPRHSQPSQSSQLPPKKQPKPTPTSSSNSSNPPQYTPYRDDPNDSSSLPPQRPDPTLKKHKSSNMFDRQFHEHNNQTESGLHAYVGEDTAAAISDGVETAKKAVDATARSLFNVAAWGFKSVVDVATNISNNALNANVLTVGKTKVTIVRQLAEGGFGIVYLVTAAGGSSSSSSSSGSDSSGGYVNPMFGGGSAPSLASTGHGDAKQYALKQLICQSKEQTKEAHAELDALMMCRDCDYIIRLIDHSSVAMSDSQHRQVNMLFPLYPRGTAWDALERAGTPMGEGAPWPFPEKKALYITYCTASALQFIHNKGYSHRDVKPHNILLADYDGGGTGFSGKMEAALQMGKPVLMDLGSMTASKVNITTKQQALQLEDQAASQTSPAYRAPELTTAPYPPCLVDERTDTWGLGCTLYCMIFGHSPFENTREGVLRLAILNGKYPLPAPKNGAYQNARGMQYSVEIIEMIQSMLQVDWNERPFMNVVIDTCKRLLNM